MKATALGIAQSEGLGQRPDVACRFEFRKYGLLGCDASPAHRGHQQSPMLPEAIQNDFNGLLRKEALHSETAKPGMNQQRAASPDGGILKNGFEGDCSRYCD